ncbi:hypothetical protein [Melittangium boletus]|uniref:Lipoprotein n=1 Tax=Melittangium boletus DSM 14713 TaxID=1294270 RepID=A0A250I9D9_9BACT|nr:hypothetical protein [Melittangium boletus]ATB27772.1 hypothetical protein MEBOL_001217 [Melittangium boletus DSM 14713]
MTKMLGTLVPLLAILAGCGQPDDPRLFWTPDLREATLSLGDGYTFTTRYTYVPSTAKLSAHWTRNGADGFREKIAEVQLFPEQALWLEERLSNVRPQRPSSTGDCWNDVATLSLRLVDHSGESRLYFTDPVKESCEPSREFLNKQDVLGVLDAFDELLPTPEL